MTMLYGSLFIFISIFTHALITLLGAKRSHVQSRIDAYLHTTPPTTLAEVDAKLESPFYKRVFVPMWDQLKRSYKKRLKTEEASKLELKLMRAGQPFQLSPVDFKIVQFALGLGFPLFGLGYGLLTNNTMTINLVLMGLGLMVALVLPNYYLKIKAEKRSKMAVKELPDMLDLLTISLEAGLGFDAALSQVVSKKQGVLSDEFKLCLEEMRIGKTRKEALNAVSDRIQSDELRTLIYNIVQAEKLGIGMVSVLRVQSEDLRELRKQRAEESAMKAPIKMMFPLVLFIFPSLFIILLGPALIQFMESF
ncbi:tight adherence protein C [Oceanobacillus limi]|uniref:Tight adherence protein C n=1 Tax=Oceanobacillus limi TaxID=930131 RepID=A0A1I0BH07_9BACI|nr:type II secretion system F family protein [Oceanobacillus limi]SET06192.1 tight adherence protein C [Oceanobacillus limi]